MASNSILSSVGLLTCVGAFIAVAVIAFIARLMSNQRVEPRSPNMWREPDSSRPQPPRPDMDFSDFGGIPTTGPVQEYERDYPGETIIGSSGFDTGAQQVSPPAENGEIPPRGEEDDH